MPRHVAALVVFSTLTWSSAEPALAQGLKSVPVLVGQQASVQSGRVHGLVCDDVGRAVPGASVVALGSAVLPLMARSDTTGQFSLILPPGEYILRATRDGYVSTYREPLRIQSSIQLERTITLVRQGVAPAGRVVLAGAVSGLGIESLPKGVVGRDDKDTDHGHDEAAWRLRHLAPTALRDVAASDSLAGLSPAGDFRPRSSFVDWMMAGSARAATSFFTNTDFSGQVNFLTTSSLDAASGWMPTDLPRGVAYVSVGAPVGSLGDWSVRGAMTAGSLSSWAVLGEYAARHDQTHAVSAGFSYSSQLSQSGRSSAPAAVNDRARTVGGMYGADLWSVGPGVQVDYGLRLDRYDYVAGSEFVSPRLGLYLSVLPATRLLLHASARSVAPGADEFLPPPSAGPWLPPERTFGALVPGAAFRAERVRNYDVGIEHEWGAGDRMVVVGLHRFRQSTRDQTATLFGLDPAAEIGHYDVATPGGVDIDGWVGHIGARPAQNVNIVVDYSVGGARWASGPDAMMVAYVAPSVARTGFERLHDVTTSIDGTIPQTSTRVSIAYRVNTVFSRSDAVPGRPSFGGRFDAEVRQALPVHPTRASQTDLLLVVRNLYRDLADTASIYDELLTVSPPMRIMGGVQIRF